MDEKLKEKIKQLAKEARVKFGQPLSSKEIQEMENKLQLTLPKEYKEFLEEFGCVETLEILGSAPSSLKRYRLPSGEELWSALGMTLDTRGYSTFPKNCVVVQDDGGGGYYCVVCGGRDHGKVIYWDSDCDPEQAYPNIPKPEWFERHPNWARGDPEKGIPPHPTGKKEDFWVEALDFWSWLIQQLEERKRKIEAERKEK